MPTKTTNTSSNTYNPGSMSNFNSFLGTGASVLNQNVQNPLQQSGFNQRLQMGNQNLFNMFNNRNSQIGSRASLFGGQTPGFLQSQLNNNSRGLAGAQGQNFNQNLLYADQLRQQSANAMLNYRPLQTGGTQTQEQSGLGTWLTPLISAGLGGLTSAMGMPKSPGGGGNTFGPGGSAFGGYGAAYPGS
jgi:hypothetical protein